MPSVTHVRRCSNVNCSVMSFYAVFGTRSIQCPACTWVGDTRDIFEKTIKPPITTLSKTSKCLRCELNITQINARWLDKWNEERCYPHDSHDQDTPLTHQPIEEKK